MIGNFIYRITHPRHEIEKTYNVTLKGIITDEELNLLRTGVPIDDNGKEYITKPAQVQVLKIDKEKKITRIKISIHEGKNRQIRRMCEAIAKKVLALHRTKIGEISVKDIPLGKWRNLTQEEIKTLIK